MKPIFVLNGPLLNLLGDREPEMYGTKTLDDVEAMLDRRATELGREIEFRQTNSEEELVGWVKEAGELGSGLVLNPAIFTHYSTALKDEVESSGLPVIEVHISNIFSRESWRTRSLISPVVRGVIVGLGVRGYVLALEALVRILEE